MAKDTTGGTKVKDLAVKGAAASVAGGRKAGGTQEDYLVVTMKDVIVTS